MARQISVWRAWFQPPRPHGDVDDRRSVSFVELFYDLVFVVLIGQIAHALGAHIGWRGLWEYAVLFTMVWFAWLNGTLYHELHGRADGRSRMYIFAQMGWLVLLAAFAGHATTDVHDGRNFAIVYTILLVQLAFQWAALIPIDEPTYRPVVMRFVATIGVAAVASLVSVFAATNDVRLWIWTATLIFLLAATTFQLVRTNPAMAHATRVTHSMSERMGLYIILVLGEVVLGVVNGMVDGGLTTVGIVTGMVALTIGWGIWWTYFDFIGLRVPKPDPLPRNQWMNTHLPLSAAIAAIGTGVTVLIEHADDASTPSAVGWLIAGSLAVVLLCEAIILSTLPTRPGLGQVPRWLIGGAAATLAIGLVAPRPWLFAALTLIPLSAVWLHALFSSIGEGYLVNGEPVDGATDNEP